MRRSAVAVLDGIADRLFSSLIKKLHEGLCRRCRRIGTDTAHVFPRTYRRLRWDVLNAFWLCRSCHRLLKNARLGKPSLMQEFYVQRYGPAMYDALEGSARLPKLPPGPQSALEERNALLRDRLNA